MKKRSLMLVSMLLAATLLLTACGGGNSQGTSASPEGQAKDSVVVEISVDPSVLCGGFASNSTVNLVSDQVFDTLITSNRDGTYEPSLATEWAFNEDNKSITFTLREGVKFHNGETMTAQDVAFSLNEVINGSYATTATSAMEKAEVVDETHVRLDFKTVYGPALETVATSYMTIFPQAYYEKDPDFFMRNPIGTGPYSFVEWVSGDHVTLTRNDNYFGEAAKIKDLTFRVYIDSGVAAIALENGEIDVLTNPLQTDRNRLQSSGNVTYNETESAMVTWAFFNCKEGVFADKRMREAVSYAVDREAVLLGAMDGVGVEANSMYPNFLPFSDNEYKTAHPYDPEKAKALLAECGYADGLELTVQTRETIHYYKPMEVLQSQLAAVGINMKLEKLEGSAWAEDVLRASNFEFNLIATTLGFFDFDERYALFVSGQPQNFYNVADSNLDAAFDINRNSMDAAEREQACHDIIRIMDEEAYILPLYGNMRGIAYRNGLQGVAADSQYIYDVSAWSWS